MFLELGVTVFVCDSDLRNPAVEYALGGPAHGWGEIIWVLRGEVIAVVQGKRRHDWRETVVKNTAKLAGPFSSAPE